MIGDTIHAVATPPGASSRGVLRVSGPAALSAVGALVVRVGESDAAGPLAAARDGLAAALRVPLAWAGGAGDATLPVMLVVMPGPGSFTGEDVVEVHGPGSAMLWFAVGRALNSWGERHGQDVRQAMPGEFTRRALENGRLDLAAAEGVLRLIHAGSERERAQAVAAVSGAVAAQVAGIRMELEGAAAMLEAGLDFESGDTGEVPMDLWMPRVAHAQRELRVMIGAMPEGAGGGAIALVGRTNAGKSSLANAVVGREVALVWDGQGTTRDVLRIPLGGLDGPDGGGALLDGPGDLPAEAGGALDQAAAALRADQFADAVGLLWVLPGDDPDGLAATAAEIRDRPSGWPPVLAVAVTRVDLRAAAGGVDPAMVRAAGGLIPATPVFATSSATGEGVQALGRWLRARAAAGVAAAGSLFRGHLEAAEAAVARALAAAQRDVGAPEGGLGLAEELVALELRAAFTALDEVSGRTTPEEVLDRLFAGFCLGK